MAQCFGFVDAFYLAPILTCGYSDVISSHYSYGIQTISGVVLAIIHILKTSVVID